MTEVKEDSEKEKQERKATSLLFPFPTYMTTSILGNHKRNSLYQFETVERGTTTKNGPEILQI